MNKEWIKYKWRDAEQYRQRTLCESIGLEGKWSEWTTVEEGKIPFGRAGLEVEYRKTKKKKYLVTFEWCDYEFFFCVEGDDDNDPKMREKIIRWISGAGEGSLADSFSSDDKEDVYIDFHCYLINKEVDMGDVSGDTWELIQRQNKEFEEYQKQQKEENERRQLQRLKKKYEGQ